jgi:hypothetical protein
MMDGWMDAAAYCMYFFLNTNDVKLLITTKDDITS